MRCARYAEAIFPERIWILGWLLQPLCIGHALLLHRIGSPFVAGDENDTEASEPGVGDLLLALYICTRPWPEAAAGLHKRRTHWLLKLWGWQLRRLKTDLALVRAQLQFHDYMARAWDGPVLWEEDGQAKPDRKPGAPVLASLKVALCGCFGWSAETALSTPIRVALLDTAAWAESQSQGRLQLVSEDEIEDIDEALRRAAVN